MKKTTKGALAAGAAAVLLAGGAGTMAAWTGSGPSLGGGSVTAGSLSITQQDAGTWKWGTAAAPGAAIPDIGAVTLVPGDSVTYTGSYKLGLSGTNLKAKITATGGALSGDLGTYLDVTPASNVDLSNLTAANNNQVVNAGATITFKSDTGNTDGAGKSASLAGTTVTLQQVQ
ncbi:alternate-type signal peptide domain-containing protein [Rhodococcus sp. D2-41]|uniref:Alternate-type signal peptide domain-containing protein n=1 Tax=Speluncibacter jeojiensis TaxID=2710754 RepID=A0A9X4LZM9_9ACTN|nr:alternate-type signal peptide domain-containing protein [Rhodococcus sp. D2-41]MDG3010572.1 alternate-type signal peptide domain-containing protein [Rhodococcus sp. D2-41]MDG3014320.1 alternate-type signal peptide domain-containing protein [Corynebacteriales bacterium D3-21]